MKKVKVFTGYDSQEVSDRVNCFLAEQDNTKQFNINPTIMYTIIVEWEE